jgi:hypothetical protein
MAPLLVNVLSVTNLASGASITLPHGLNYGGSGVIPTQVICDRASPIGVTGATLTAVTFTNGGAAAASANFRAEYDHSIHAVGAAPLNWQGFVPAGAPPSGPAGGDLSGNYPNPTVDGLQGQPVSATAPTVGQSLAWSGTAWTPTTLPAFWTEAQSTAAPNATVPAVSWTPSNAAADVDAIVRPKGAGALLAQVPDNALLGGNKRGQRATDLQRERGLASQVASGNYSVLAGGNANAASGLEAVVVGGRGNTASGADTFIGGGTNQQALGTGATVGGGDSNNAAADFCTISGGRSNTALGGAAGYATVAGGNGNIAFADYATVAGGATNIIVGVGAAIGGGRNSVLTGEYTAAPGGQGLAASALSEAALGQHNVDFLGDPSNFVGTDAILTVGNGTGVGAESNALTVLKDGSMGVNLGAAKPTEKLDVAGNVKFSGALMPNNAPGAAGEVLVSAGAGLPPVWLAGTAISVLPQFGNVAVVDAANGNNATGSVNGLPFLTVEAGLAAVAAFGSPATLWVMPGTYTLASATTGLTMPTGCAMRGHNVQTTRIVMNASNPGSTVTMLTMGENSRVEDVTLLLNSSNATTNLVGVNTPGTSSTTSKLRTAVVTVDNSGLAVGTTTNVYGIYDNGTGVLGPASFSFNFTRGVTVNVFSNGGGNKRAVYVNTANDITFRDTNFYVRAPTNAASTGSYVGVETTDAGCSAQFRTSSISGPSTAGGYTGSDILQTSPGTGFINNGIQLGPGCDLINKTAGGKPFTTYVTPTTLEYGLNGNVAAAVHYLWPGVQTASDNTQIFYRFQQKSICQGMSINMRTAPGVGHFVTITVLRSATGIVGSGVATLMTATISGANKQGTQYTLSENFAQGEYLALQISGNAGNAAQDVVVELDLF